MENIRLLGMSFRPKGEIFPQIREKISRREAARNDTSETHEAVSRVALQGIASLPSVARNDTSERLYCEEDTNFLRMSFRPKGEILPKIREKISRRTAARNDTSEAREAISRAPCRGLLRSLRSLAMTHPIG